MAAVGSLRAWILASRPRTLSAVVAPVLIGAALAGRDGVFRFLPAAAALLAGLLIQIGTNLANDYYDYVKGADTVDRLGGMRVTQAGLLAPRVVRGGMITVFGLAVLVGGYLVAVGGVPILVIGIASVISGIAYTGGPYPIGYVGLGDLFTFVFFGPVAVAGTYLVQARTVTPGTLLAGVGVGALVTAILVVNNLRDIPTDRAAGKRTLAVRVGTTWTKVEYVLLLAVGAAIPVIGWLAGRWSAGPLLGVIAMAATVGPPLHRVLRFGDPTELNAALGSTARMVGAYGLGFAVGAFLWR